MATFLEYRTKDWDNRRLGLAVILSLLLHGLVALILLIEPWTWKSQPEPPPILAEFVMPEPPKAAPPPAPPPPAPPPQAAAPTPPPPQEQVRPIPPPSIPQLQNAPVTEAPSRAPPSAGEKARTQSSEKPQPAPLPDRIGPSTTMAPPAQRERSASSRPTGNRAQGEAGAAGKAGESMTQSESDFFLAQIVRAWVIDFDAPQFANLVIEGGFGVLPNGMLAPPYGKNDPWDMNVMVRNWNRIEAMRGPQAVAYRTAMETFMQAMRLAQPFTMPPDAQGYPKILQLNFRVGDL